MQYENLGSLFFKVYLFIYLFIYLLAVVGLCCCTQFFSSFGEQEDSLIAVCGLLIVAASLIAECGL